MTMDEYQEFLEHVVDCEVCKVNFCPSGRRLEHDVKRRRKKEAA